MFLRDTAVPNGHCMMLLQRIRSPFWDLSACIMYIDVPFASLARVVFNWTFAVVIMYDYDVVVSTWGLFLPCGSIM